MPYLQHDTPFAHPPAVKQRLARRLGEIYAHQMQAALNRITIAIRELGEGGVWPCFGKVESGLDFTRPASRTAAGS